MNAIRGLLGLLLCGLVLGTPAWADDQAKTPQAKPALAEEIKSVLDNSTKLNQLLDKKLRSISATMARDPDAAEMKIDELEAALKGLKPNPQAKVYLDRVDRSLIYYRQRLILARITVAKLKASLKENPNDAKSIAQLAIKLRGEISPLARSDPKKAQKMLAAALATLAELEKNADSDAAKKAIASASRSLSRLERTIQSGLKLAAVIGKDAAPLELENWVNGTPLTDADLKGKVVLLDFWAVWCGPCIATFPHLREWQEKYQDKDFVMIGLTRFYNYQWDDDKGRASRSKEPVDAKDEIAMLQKFAESHDLHHRFAIQPKTSQLSKFYAVSGIPHVVILDQQGKVRMIRVGSGEANAKALGDLLEELLGQ